MKLLQIPGMESLTDSIKVPDPEKELAQLKGLSFDDLVNKLANDIIQFAIHLAIAIVVFYVGRFAIRKLYIVCDRVMTRRNVDKSLTTFVLSLINMVLYFILVVTVISILGIETSSFIAIFASAGVAIGMALSGTLQNFAGGVLILLLKPYKIGDYIETQGFSGTVSEIQIFNTIICTPDNKSIILPNGPLSTGSINNWSREDYRRVEWTIGITYGNDVETARKVILDMLQKDKDVVQTTVAEHRIAAEEAQLKREVEKDEMSVSEANAPAADENEEKRRSALWRLFHARRRLAEIEKSAEYKRLTHLDHILRSPTVTLGNLGASSVDLTVRAWVPSAKFWEIYYLYNERFYNELPQAGISFPFPQLDVHLNQQN